MDKSTKEIEPILLTEEETFVAYSKKLNKSLIIFLEGTTLDIHRFLTADKKEIEDIVKKQIEDISERKNVPDTLCSKNVDDGPIHLLPITSMVYGRTIDIVDDDITATELNLDNSTDDNELGL